MTLVDPHQHRLLILDFGSQYTQLIARRVREIGVYCEIRPFDIADDDVAAFAPKGIILSGGPESVTEEDSPRAPESVWSLGVPVLGICYGMQIMAVQLGGEVQGSATQEFGHADLVLQGGPETNWLAAATQQDKMPVWMSHGDKVKCMPRGFEVLASSKDCDFAAMADVSRQFYGLQFHPEVTHTPQGLEMLRHFIVERCACDTLWTESTIIEDAIVRIRKQVGDDHVILGLSGGVDSSVAAVLLHKAIGEQLTCVFVDNALLRHQESEQVQQVFADHLGVKVVHVDASQQFLNALAGVNDPEEKRKIIGREFVHVFQAEAEKLKQVKWLAQGTIYPDVVESAATKHGKSHVIKSHHNVGGLPETLHLGLVEPLRELFKDEVRRIGEALGLPHNMVYRHPFPGPGLGVRVLGEITDERLAIVRQADHIFLTELHAYDYYEKVSQAFAVFLPVKAVGVAGDARRYDYVIALRAVETVDFMTAQWADLPTELLAMVARRIMNEVPHVSRVVYDISSKPPATIEWE